MIKKEIIEYETYLNDGMSLRVIINKNEKAILIHNVWANGTVGDDVVALDYKDVANFFEIITDVNEVISKLGGKK